MCVCVYVTMLCVCLCDREWAYIWQILCSSQQSNTVIWQASLAELAPVPLWLRTHGLWMTWSWLRHAESFTPCFLWVCTHEFAHLDAGDHLQMFMLCTMFLCCVRNACICASKSPNSCLICNLFIFHVVFLRSQVMKCSAAIKMYQIPWLNAFLHSIHRKLFKTVETTFASVHACIITTSVQ